MTEEQRDIERCASQFAGEVVSGLLRGIVNVGLAGLAGATVYYAIQGNATAAASAMAVTVFVLARRQTNSK